MPQHPTDRAASAVTVDPESLVDCSDLSDALYRETGVEVDPAAIRDALRHLARRTA